MEQRPSVSRREEYFRSAVRQWISIGGATPECFKHCGIVTKQMVDFTNSEVMRKEEPKVDVERKPSEIAWTDGSARDSKDVTLRRAGWGVIFSNGEIRGGPFYGEHQTVYRAELRAVVAAL